MLQFREFKTYEDYVFLQGGKSRFARERLLAGHSKSLRAFSTIFQRLQPFCQPEPFLCLGARTGAENEAACANGFPGSIGIDLHPVRSSVLQGDWHNIPFLKESFTNIYTNSIDHCLHLDRLGSEIKRVMKPDGAFILQIPDKESWVGVPIEQRKQGFEAMFWEHSQEVCEALAAFGFEYKLILKHGVWSTYLLRRIA